MDEDGDQAKFCAPLDGSEAEELVGLDVNSEGECQNAKADFDLTPEQSATDKALPVVKLCSAMSQLWVVIFLAGAAVGLVLPLESYISLNFFAHKYTDVAQEHIHCETDTDAPYCKDAVADNVKWTSITSFIISGVHVALGPTLGVLSDAYGRKPVVCLCEVMQLLPLTARALFVHFYISLYYYYALLAFQFLPVVGVWFALVTDLVVDPKSRAVAFGLILVWFEVAVLVGMVFGSLLPLRTTVTCCVILKSANAAYLLLCLRESSPPERRNTLNKSQLLPFVGLSILIRNGNLLMLSTIFFVSALAGVGLDKIGTSYLQKYLSWSKGDNYMGAVVGQLSILAWVGLFLRPLTAKFGEVGLLFIGQAAGTVLCIGMLFMSSATEIFVLRAFLVGALALSFPATAALKGGLVDDFEQGHVQGALTTMKSVAAALGPMLFGVIFNGVSDSFPSSIWIVGGFLHAILLPVIWSLPRDLLKDKDMD